MRNKKNIMKLFSFTIFIFWFSLNIIILPHYGISWDGPEHYQRGQVYLQYFLTGNGNVSNTKASHLSIYQTSKADKDWMSFSYWIKNDAGHPPLNGILAALSNRIFYQHLGILGDIESYHLFVVSVSVFLTILVFYWVRAKYGLFAGIVSFLSLALYPLFFGESHFNIKDPVEASFYAVTLLFFYKGITKNSWKNILISSIFAGLALGTKFNILFIVFIIIPWLLIYKWDEIKSFKLGFSKKLIIACLISPLIAFGILYATWPFLWQSPINNLLKIFTYYKEIGSNINYQSAEYLIFGEINTFAPQWIFYTTPLVTLVLFTFGVIYSLTKGFKEKNKTSLFILLWFLVPIVRVSFPNASIYGGVRQIMEYIPAMAILAGIGASYIVKLFDCYIVKKFKWNRIAIKQLNNGAIVFGLQFLIILSFLPITLKLISIHPNENVYFNPLIGGLKGAKEKNIPYWGFNLGSSYKQGVEWLNKNAEKNANVALLLGTGNNIPRILFRDDLVFYNGAWSGTQRKGEYLIEAVFNGWIREWYYAGEYVDRALKPVYEVKVDEVPILKVWKNDSEHTYSKFLTETELNSQDIAWRQDENTLFIELKNIFELMSISVDVENKECFDFVSGQVFLSSDNDKVWQLEKEPIRSSRKTKEGMTYPLAAKKAKYIRVEFKNQKPCPFSIDKVNVSYLP